MSWQRLAARVEGEPAGHQVWATPGLRWVALELPLLPLGFLFGGESGEGLLSVVSVSPNVTGSQIIFCFSSHLPFSTSLTFSKAIRVIPPYPWGTRFKTPSGCCNPRWHGTLTILRFPLYVHFMASPWHIWVAASLLLL